jgi:activator of HSP90 ATPase
VIPIRRIKNFIHRVHNFAEIKISKHLCKSEESADKKSLEIRKAMAQSCILITALTLTALPIALAQSDKSITIHQEIEFNATPEKLYEALLNSKQFTEFSGRPAEINREVGGTFSLFKGHIIGRNVELVPNERIVQAWRVVTWPEGAYSIVRFELKPQGSRTHLVFDHIGFPEGLHDHLAAGWDENYWSLLKKYFP